MSININGIEVSDKLVQLLFKHEDVIVYEEVIKMERNIYDTMMSDIDKGEFMPKGNMDCVIEKYDPDVFISWENFHMSDYGDIENFLSHIMNLGHRLSDLNKEEGGDNYILNITRNSSVYFGKDKIDVPLGHIFKYININTSI